MIYAMMHRFPAAKDVGPAALALLFSGVNLTAQIRAQARCGVGSSWLLADRAQRSDRSRLSRFSHAGRCFTIS